jgi:ribonuclease HI
VPAAGKVSVIVPILKKSNSDRSFDNMRPITLQASLYKIVTKCLTTRLGAILSKHHGSILHAAQEGFLPGGDSKACVESVLDVWEHAKENSKGVYNLLYDIRGAYDSVRHDDLIRSLERLRMPADLIEFFRDSLTGLRACVRTAYGNTDEFVVGRSIPQGGPPSPILYVCFSDVVHCGFAANPLYGGCDDGYRMHGVSIASKGFADDTKAISGTYEGLCRQHEWAVEWGRWHQTRWHSAKTKLLGIVEGKERRCMVNDGSIAIEGEVVPVVAPNVGVPYLGARIQLDLGWSSQLEAISGSIRGFCNAVERHSEVFVGNLGRAVWAFNTFLLPKLVYRLAFVGPKVTDARGWDQRIRQCLGSIARKSTGCPQGIKPAIWSAVAGVRLPSLEEKLLKVTEAFFRLNAGQSRSWSARARWVARPRAASQRCATNRLVRAADIALSFGWTMQQSRDDGMLDERAQVLSLAPVTGITARFQLGGEEYKAVGNHCELWRRGEVERPWPVVSMYTDGSWHAHGLDGKSAPVSAWAVIVENDWLRECHGLVEPEGSISRSTLSRAVLFGGRINARQGVGNYDAELQAIARALTLVPADTSVVIYTDSQSSIDAISRYRLVGGRRQLRMAGRTHLSLISGIMKAKVEEGADVHLLWVKAHAKAEDALGLASVGNRLADHVAGQMCNDRWANSFRCNHVIPWGQYDPFVTIEDSVTGRVLSADPRRSALGYLASECRSVWSMSQSQSRFSVAAGAMRDLWVAVMAERPACGGLVMALAADVVQWRTTEQTDAEGKVSSSHVERMCPRCGRKPGQPTRTPVVDSASHWVVCPRWSALRLRSAEEVRDIVSEHTVGPEAVLDEWSAAGDRSLASLIRALGLGPAGGDSPELTAACFGAFDRHAIGAVPFVRSMGPVADGQRDTIVRRIRLALLAWVSQVHSSLHGVVGLG